MFLVNRNKTALTGLAAALFVLSSLFGYAFGQANEDESSGLQGPQPKYTTSGVEGCLECHAGVLMTLVADTAHGNKDNPHTPYANQGCESCHGPGSFHSSRARGGVGFPALLAFRPWESTEAHNQACMNCHGKDMGELKGMNWKGSLHETRGMTCVYCHQSHVSSDKMRDPQQQRDRCSKCHGSKIAGHTGGEDLLKLKKCSECHKVHELTAGD